MLPVALLHFLDDRRDRRRVDAGLFHQRGGPLCVVGVDRIEEVLDLADRRQLFQTSVPSKSLSSIVFLHLAASYVGPGQMRFEGGEVDEGIPFGDEEPARESSFGNQPAPLRVVIRGAESI